MPTRPVREGPAPGGQIMLKAANQSTRGSHPRQGDFILNVNADLKHSALAHLPSGTFTANAAWLVLAVIAFNLTRTAATITGAAWRKRPPRRSAGN